MRLNRHQFTVAEIFLPALINDDYDGLDDRDDQSLTEFMQMAYDQHGIGTWDMNPDDSPRFRTCDITGLQANCFDVFYCTPNGA